MLKYFQGGHIKICTHEHLTHKYTRIPDYGIFALVHIASKKYDTSHQNILVVNLVKRNCILDDLAQV